MRLKAHPFNFRTALRLQLFRTVEPPTDHGTSSRGAELLLVREPSIPEMPFPLPNLPWHMLQLPNGGYQQVRGWNASDVITL
jgi:hypothetical protein